MPSRPIQDTHWSIPSTMAASSSLGVLPLKTSAPCWVPRMNAKCAANEDEAPCRPRPHWSVLPSPLVSLVSLCASATNSFQVFGGEPIPAALKSFLL